MGWLPYLKGLLARGVRTFWALMATGAKRLRFWPFCPSTIVFFPPLPFCLNGDQTFSSPPLHYYHHYKLLLSICKPSTLVLQSSPTFSLAAMEETLGSKPRWASSSNPNTMTYTTFARKYVSYLLPALLKAANRDIKTEQIEKIVRYEVDMALVLSTDEFKWSRALKNKLEESSNTSKHRISSKCRSKVEFHSHFGILKRFEHLQTFAVIPRPIIVVEAARPRKSSQRSIKKRAARGDEELAWRIRILRRILPGGSEMGVFELLTEVQSYLVFLRMQVDVLRSLVDDAQ